MTFPKKIIPPEQAQARLEDLCVRSEHCTGEMRLKLRQWGVAAPDADRIVDALVAGKFVDDERFAGSYVRYKLRFDRWGRRKIQMGLAAKCVDRGIIAAALADIDPDEYLGILTALLASKTKLHPELLADYDGRTRLFRFALQRGFESPLISKVIKSLI